MSRFHRSTALALAIGLALPAAVPGQTSIASRARVPAATASEAAPTVADDPVRDSAITELQDFLSRYPNSALRANALFELGELLVRRADEQFAETQRAAGTDSTRSGEAPIRPNYREAIAVYEELVRRYPTFDRIDAAAYTLGTLYTFEQRYADAVRMFQTVTTREDSRFRAEALFRLGDAYFELAAKERGAQRRADFARAAESYERATQVASKESDIYFLALYKLGWSYYNQASSTNQEEYRKAVQVFGQLVDAYDKLTPEQQSRLGLRGEAIEYMAVAFTQVGGSNAANQYFASHGGAPYRLTVLRRVAASLRDQGDFPGAVQAYRTLLNDSPNDTTALQAQREIIDIYQNRMLSFDSAQAARLELVERFAPGSAWAQANPGQVAEGQAAREDALRQSAQFILAQAQTSRDRARFAQAAELYRRYVAEFPNSERARQVNAYYAEALYGQGEYLQAGAAYTRAAFGAGPVSVPDTTAADSAAGRRAAAAVGAAPVDSATFVEQAARNAIVAFDSALVRNRSDAAAQDSMFAAVDRYVAAFPQTDMAKTALFEKGRRASETQRWDVMATAFRQYVERYPNDRNTLTAQKYIGDALYRSGQYAEAQTQWESAQTAARSAGRRALADSIAAFRTTAAAGFADTLVQQGQYRRAAEEVYVAFADKNAGSTEAPDALRDAIETYMLVVRDSAGKFDENAKREARQRAAELSTRLVTQYPSYKYRTQYQALAANLHADLGQNEEAVAALRTLISENRNFPGRADAMIRLAVTLDTMQRNGDAARAYAEFAQAYPRDPRAADALYNAAVTYVEAGDSATAARTYGTFASRYPRDERAAQAQAFRVGLLRASGNNAAVAEVCSGRVTEELQPICAESRAARYFQQSLANWNQYRSLTLRIPSRAQLTQAGVRSASADKQRLLGRINDGLRTTIETGNPHYLAAATYYLGLSQWEYGNFLTNVELPAGLTDAEQQQAREGSARQAQEFYDAARNIWRQLVEKAQQEPALRDDPAAQPWIDRARAAIEGNVDNSPPTSARARPLEVAGRMD